MIWIDEFSACTCPVTMTCKQQILGTATAFFWRHRGRTHLVSNWHVLSGREPSSGQPKDKVFGAVPDMLQVTGMTKRNTERAFSMTVPLFNEDGTPVWWQHKQFGQKADVAVIELDQLRRQGVGLSRIPCLNEARQVFDMALRVGQDVFVLGFPLRLLKTGTFPIWKRASVATEPDYPVNNMPCLLIDTATREGMSGAPVIHRSSAYEKVDGSRILAGSPQTQFLGIYSGRYVGELGEAQLGIVWKRELLEEILRTPALGGYLLG